MSLSQKRLMLPGLMVGFLLASGFPAVASIVDGIANLVLGQADFMHGAANRGGTVGANTLESPAAIAVDASGNLWITDYYNGRALFLTQPDGAPPQAPAGLSAE